MNLWPFLISMSKSSTSLLYTMICAISLHVLIVSLSSHTNSEWDRWDPDSLLISWHRGLLRLWTLSLLIQNTLDFFCLTLLHLLDVQMQGKASMSCSIFHANRLFLNPYLKMYSGLSYIFYLKNPSCIPELFQKHCVVVWRESGCELCASSEPPATVLSRPRWF